MNTEHATAGLRDRLIDLLGEHDRANIDAVLEGFDLDEDTLDEVQGELIDRSERLIYFEIVFDASPMSNTHAASIDLLDLGGDFLFVVSPADLGIDAPGVAWAFCDRDDKRRAFELVGETITKSRLENELPAGGSLSDRIEVAKDFPQDVLQAAFSRIFTARHGDIDEAREIIARAGGNGTDGDEFVDRYLHSVVRRDP
ncbi:MAG TPA: hypothetical protein VJ935_11170 [Acidimicrobiia bacterium]|nr:hypothetical protein [Acidimicrobiia bacterium]